MNKTKPQIKYHSKVKSKYDFLKFIGSGGFGVVITARLRKYNKNKDKDATDEKVFPAKNDKSLSESIDPTGAMRQLIYYNPRGLVVLKRIYTSFPANADPYEHLTNMEKEMLMLIEMRTFKHANLVKLLTAMVEIPPPDWIEKNDEYWPLLKQSASEKFPPGDQMCVVTIAQEYCRLGCLSNWLYEDSNCDRNLCWDFAPHISDGLRFLHDRKIIHRDLKPQNILLSSVSDDCGGVQISPGKYAVLKIGDFGLAKILPFEVTRNAESIDNHNPTEMTVGVGTNLYKAPELKTGGYDSAVDIFAFGIILLEMFVKFPSWKDMALQVTFLKFEDILTPEVIERKLRFHKSTPVYDEPMASLISKMMSIDTKSRPDARSVHSELLSFTKRSLKFPIINIPRVSESHSSIPRNELDKLLQLYDSGCESIVFLTGNSGSGKTNLSLQFTQILVSREEDKPSIHFITAWNYRNLKKYLIPIALSLKVDVNRSNGFRRTTSELINDILTGFKGRSVLILDGCGVTPEHNVCITSFWKLARSIKTDRNRPFILITTREIDYLQQLKAQRDFYSKFKRERKKYFEDCKEALQNIWKDTDGLEPPLEIKLGGFSTEEGMEFLNNCLDSTKNVEDTAGSKILLLNTLENHPFRLELSCGVIKLTRMHFDPNFSIQDFLKSVNDVEVKYRRENSNSIPGIDNPERHYSDVRMDRIVMFMARQTIRFFSEVEAKIQEIKRFLISGFTMEDGIHDESIFARQILNDLSILRVNNKYPFNNIFSFHQPDPVVRMAMVSNDDFDDEFAYAQDDSTAEFFNSFKFRK